MGKKVEGIAIISEDFVSTDLTYCQRISKETGIPLTIYNSTTSEILEAVENTIKILKNFNDIEIRNNVVMYLAIKWAKDNNKKSIITGDGADELFAGYNKHYGEWQTRTGSWQANFIHLLQRYYITQRNSVTFVLN